MTRQQTTCQCNTTTTSTDGRSYPVTCLLHPRDYFAGGAR